MFVLSDVSLTPSNKFCVTMTGSASVDDFVIRNTDLHDSKFHLYVKISFVCQNFMGNKGQFLLLLSLSEAHRIFGFTSVGGGCINSCANTKEVDGKGGHMVLGGYPG